MVLKRKPYITSVAALALLAMPQLSSAAQACRATIITQVDNAKCTDIFEDGNGNGYWDGSLVSSGCEATISGTCLDQVSQISLGDGGDGSLIASQAQLSGPPSILLLSSNAHVGCAGLSQEQQRLVILQKQVGNNYKDLDKSMVDFACASEFHDLD
ncbi:MAG: hypothetical protein KA142_01380 [Chromatiaceae bacterium]|nr:hypothetical protein [Chromatiaceae bacterium]